MLKDYKAGETYSAYQYPLEDLEDLIDSDLRKREFRDWQSRTS